MSEYRVPWVEDVIAPSMGYYPHPHGYYGSRFSFLQLYVRSPGGGGGACRGFSSHQLLHMLLRCHMLPHCWEDAQSWRVSLPSGEPGVT